MRWPIHEHVVFDFDSTLSTIEGIDVLADQAGVGDEVSELTQRAMDGSTKLESVYEKRLAAIRPTRGEIRALKEQYRKHLTEDAQALVGALQSLGHAVYIVSGGLIEPIIDIGVALGVPADNIKAVEIQYDEFSGEWWLAHDGRDGRNQPFLKSNRTALEQTHGKAGVIKKLLQGKRGRAMLVGDGTSDLVARPSVDLFVGYTGVVARDRIIESAPVILKSRSLAPVLILSGGSQALSGLGDTPHQRLVDKACNLIDGGAIEFNDAALSERFRRAYERERGADTAIF